MSFCVLWFKSCFQLWICLQWMYAPSPICPVHIFHQFRGILSPSRFTCASHLSFPSLGKPKRALHVSYSRVRSPRLLISPLCCLPSDFFISLFQSPSSLAVLDLRVNSFVWFKLTVLSYLKLHLLLIQV